MKPPSGILEAEHGAQHEPPAPVNPSIEELLAGKKIDMPAQQDIRSFKQAPKAKGKKNAEHAQIDAGGSITDELHEIDSIIS